jgi:hypothetical protein
MFVSSLKSSMVQNDPFQWCKTDHSNGTKQTIPMGQNDPLYNIYNNINNNIYNNRTLFF